MRDNIPRVVIAGTQSGSGKTTLVTGLLAALKARGLRVQSYKVGPDYIDPGFHALASGRPAHNLDTWLVGEERLPALFAESMGDADLAVIEGVMGLYDGGRKGVSSTAEVAKLLDAPVLLAIDCKSMGASAAAIALGFRAYDKDVEIAGVLLNRLGSSTHEAMIRSAMEGIQMPVYGAVHRDDSLHLSERHLGLTPTTETEAAGVVKKMGEAALRQVDVEGIVALAKTARALPQLTPPPLGEVAPQGSERVAAGEILNPIERIQNHDTALPSAASGISDRIGAKRRASAYPPRMRSAPPPRGEALGTCAFTDTSGKKLRIAVARDAAFSFYYPTSLAVLERLGATLVPFSPLEDAALPEDVSGALFGGGFPEMFAEKLAANQSMRAAIRAAAARGLPIYAECGGYMYLMEELVDFDGNHHAMCGVFSGSAVMTKKLQMVGYVTARLNEDTILGTSGTELKGHEFHFSQEEEGNEPARPFTFTKLRNGMAYAAGQRYKNALGSYLHLHFAGCPEAAKHFVEACARTRVKL